MGIISFFIIFLSSPVASNQKQPIICQVPEKNHMKGLLRHLIQLLILDKEKEVGEVRWPVSYTCCGYNQSPYLLSSCPVSVFPKPQLRVFHVYNFWYSCTLLKLLFVFFKKLKSIHVFTWVYLLWGIYMITINGNKHQLPSREVTIIYKMNAKQCFII